MADDIFDSLFDGIEEMSEDIDVKASSEDLLTSTVELNAVEFAEHPYGLNFKFRPAQKVILKLFYGLELDDVIYPEDVQGDLSKSRNIWSNHPITGRLEGPFSELGYYKFLLEEGRTNAKLGHTYNTLCLVIGRRAGKSTLSTVMTSYEVYRLMRMNCPQRHYNLKTSQVIKVFLVGVDKNQSKELFDVVSNDAGSCKFLQPFVSSDLGSEISFSTPYDIEIGKNRKGGVKPSIKIYPVSSSGAQLRGGTAIQAIMDEVAHMKDKRSNKGSADAIFTALKPAVATFGGEGKMILISTPNGPREFFYEFYKTSMNDVTESTLCVQAPTWEINPGVISRNDYIQSYNLDSSKFYQEYGALFESTSNEYIQSLPLFYKNLYKVSNYESDEECWLDERSFVTQGIKGNIYYMSIDLAQVNDSTVISIGHPDLKTGKIIVDYYKRYTPGDTPYTMKNGYLSMDKIVEEVAQLHTRFNIVKTYFDQHGAPPFIEAVNKKGLKDCYPKAMGENINSSIYKDFRDLYINERLEIPGTVELVQEFKSLVRQEKRKDTKTLLKVEAMSGLHDDIPDSIARLVYIIYREIFVKELIVGATIDPAILAKKNNMRIATSSKHNAKVMGRSMSGMLNNISSKSGLKKVDYSRYTRKYKR